MFFCKFDLRYASSGFNAHKAAEGEKRERRREELADCFIACFTCSKAYGKSFGTSGKIKKAVVDLFFRKDASQLCSRIAVPVGKAGNFDEVDSYRKFAQGVLHSVDLNEVLDYVRSWALPINLSIER